LETISEPPDNLARRRSVTRLPRYVQKDPNIELRKFIHSLCQFAKRAPTLVNRISCDQYVLFSIAKKITNDDAGVTAFVRQVSPSPLAQRGRPAAVLVDRTPISDPFQRIQPITIEQVRRAADEPLFNSLIEHHHYLGYEQLVGEHLKYLAWSGGRPIACLAWSSAPRHLGSRDRYIGWSAQARRTNIRFIAYNTRFLILPWVRVPHLASHLLGRVTARLSRDWEHLYKHPVYFAETFIDPGRFRGTCYRTANWKLLGVTTGHGKNDHTNRPNRSIKEVLGYGLDPRFRQLLSQLRRTHRSNASRSTWTNWTACSTRRGRRR
jgi:hypothetical protein